MILVGNIVPRASFRDMGKAIFFFKIALGMMLFSCRVNICSAKAFPETTSRSNHQRVLENFANFTGKHLCWSLSLMKSECLQLYLKETLAQMFSCEICDIFKNTYFIEHLRTELLLNFKDKFYVKLKF